MTSTTTTVHDQYVSDDTHRQDQIDAAQRPSTQHNGRSVLVVEDDQDIRELLCELLEEEGYEVALAKSGAAGMVYLLTNPPPCCILLDLWMPVVSGITFRHALLRDPHLATIPVIVVSANLRGPRLIAELEAAAYLEKPFAPDELVATVKTVGC